MAGFIDNQHIAKRCASSNYKPNTNSAVFNTGFMSQFKQKPARDRRINFSPFKYFPHTKKLFKPVKINRRHLRAVHKKQHGNGFSFSIPSLTTLAVIAGMVIVFLAAMHWEGISVKIPHKYAFQPVADEKVDHYALKYAEMGIPSIFDSVASPQEPQNDEVDADVQLDEFPLEIMDKFEWSSYTVKKGDSVSKISVRFGVSMDAIIASNEIHNARRLREGEILRIPNIDGIPHTVKKGDSLSSISKTYNVPLEIILDVNDLNSANIEEGGTLFIPGARMPLSDFRQALGDLFTYPIRKNISSNFGWRKDPFSGEQSFHSGIDMKADTGTAVKAAMDGTVSIASNSRVYGNFIILNHDNGYQTLYAHLSAFSVKQGEKVIQGKKIGEVGNTGLSTGPHLHFGVFKDGKWKNPLDLLN
ncbi:MAG: M23 family metallopeptidase [Treponema sp.]|jgi:murein DD-endopeptidase MepM/ murein hydrolase activator NlpD|nr:M23 family metallopeptidase [Treponema sp.]